jgi:two-component system alkaline phosphatase synthesis response regulator PhoP
MTSPKILVVDDELDIREIISYNLKKEGYQVFNAADGLEAIRVAKEVKPDLIILDVMMPRMDGIEACRLLREMEEFQQTYILFLTARTEEFSEIAGFNVGADDYIAKPIKTRALLSRISAVFRRSRQGDVQEEQNPKLIIGDLTIDREAYIVFKGDTKIVLAKKEFELLHLLGSRPGKVYTREAIMQKIWDDSVIVTPRTVDVHIRKIREKLGDNYVSTVKGVGYKFELA